MKLHLGCGRARMAGWLNVDLYPSAATDLVFDLLEPWPLASDTAEAIYASHMLEHLERPLDFFREAHRVLRPNGSMHLRMPYGGHRAAWWDLTHVRPWFAENFAFFQPGYSTATGNLQHESWRWHFGVSDIKLRLGPEIAERLCSRWRRRLFGPWLRYCGEAFEELHAELYALKTEEEIARYRDQHTPWAVPVTYVAYAHHLQGRTVQIGEPVTLVPIAEVNGFAGCR